MVRYLAIDYESQYVDEAALLSRQYMLQMIEIPNSIGEKCYRYRNLCAQGL